MRDEFTEDTSWFRNELCIRSLFYYSAIINDRHLVCGLYGAESVCYSQHGSVFADILERLIN